jgi:hypothetical protein
MVSVDHFRQELLAQFRHASNRGMVDLLVVSGELFRLSGGYPGSDHGLAECCEAMRDEIKGGDITLTEQSNGAGMTVRYYLPRVKSVSGLDSGL